MKIFIGVFDLLPEHLSAPWAYLAALLTAIGASVLVAGFVMGAVTRRSGMETLRDL